jgi:CBS domain-containing protein/sporulation protein YlmC with PRC-barrel domain
MVYFSTLKDTKIFTQDKQYLGKIIDLLFLPVKTPLVTKFVVKTKTGKVLYIPVQHINKNGIEFTIVNNYYTEEKAENEISLLSKVQNQQIVDIKGTEVIRVNDVVINDIPDYTISGIDIGILGIFRWIGAAKFVAKLLSHLNIRYKSDFVPWSEIEEKELANNRIVLKSEKEKLKKIYPEDLAEHLEHATVRNVLRSLRVMDKELSARVVADLNVDYQREIFQRFSAEHSGEILSLIDADEAVDVLLSLDSGRRKNILAHIKDDKKAPILHLLHHAKTPIGHLMTTEYLSVYADTSVKNTLDKLRKNTSEYSELLYIYVINKNEQIVGVINIHELLMQPSDMPLYKIMNQNLVLGRLTTPKEIVLRRLIKYNLYALPIVDENRKLLGIVPLQNIAEDIFEKK